MIRSKKRWQLSLSTLLLSAAAIAVWFAHHRTEKSIKELRAKLNPLRFFASELIVNDTAKFSAIRLRDNWVQASVWKVYVPPQSNAKLKLQLTEIDTDELGQASHEVSLPSGRHEIRLHYEFLTSQKQMCVVRIFIDGQLVLEPLMPSTWYRRMSLESSNDLVKNGFGLDTPLKLYCRRFIDSNQSKIAESPGDGILLWIDNLN